MGLIDIKLLLVEDERLTREGILQEVDWMRLHIDEVREAVDGIDALAVTEQYEPDIVLTDIKMPRMDGVSLAFQLRRKYPNCKIIFMSGYAEKEYLKAAITLKAISYVEKPLDVDELQDALANAALEYEAERKQQQMLSLSAERTHLLKRQIAHTLIRSNWDESALAKELSLLPESVYLTSSAVTCIIKLEREHPELELLEQLLEESSEEHQYIPLLFAKDEMHVVLHLIASERFKLSLAYLKDFFTTFSYHLRQQKVRHDIAAGQAVGSLAQVRDSYTTAALMLQETFFRGPYALSICTDSGHPASGHAYTPDSKWLDSFKDMLEKEHFDEYERLLRRLTAEYRQSEGTPVNQVKELYYRLLLESESFIYDRGLSGNAGRQTPAVLWERMSEAYYLDELQEMVMDRLQAWRNAWEESQNGQGYISSKIVRYVHQHYANADLSVQEISEHLQLTASYIISAYKEATGTTVKQYLLEYRIDKARELLRDRNLKVADIAVQVGFKDGEYFAKVFRKHTGMAPSEYRERFQ
jgi:two-component system, response regulator YesN